MLSKEQIEILFIKCITDMNKLLGKETIEILDINLLIKDINEVTSNKYKTMAYYSSSYEDENDDINDLDGKKVICIDPRECINKDVTYNLLAHELCHYITDRITNEYSSNFCTDSSPMFCCVVRYFNNNNFNIEMNKNYEKLFNKHQKVLCKAIDELEGESFVIIKNYIEQMCKIIKYNEFLYSTSVCKELKEILNTRWIYTYFDGERSRTLAKKNNSRIEIRLGLDTNFADYKNFIDDLIENARFVKSL